MRVIALTIRLYAPWVHSLKEKRMEVKSLIAKLQNKFHVSAAEVDEQDIHQTIVIGIAAVAIGQMQADSIADHLCNYVEANTEAEIISIQRDFY